MLLARIKSVDPYEATLADPRWSHAAHIEAGKSILTMGPPEGVLSLSAYAARVGYKVKTNNRDGWHPRGTVSCPWPADLEELVERDPCKWMLDGESSTYGAGDVFGRGPHTQKATRWKSEEAAREALQEMFPGHLFPKLFPRELKSRKGGQMSLDGCCETVALGGGYRKLAFERQGIQHYVRTKFFHKTEQEFEDQKGRDTRKAEWCAREGIALLTIPYWYTHKTPRVVWRRFIRSELEELGLGELLQSGS